MPDCRINRVTSVATISSLGCYDGLGRFPRTTACGAADFC